MNPMTLKLTLATLFLCSFFFINSCRKNEVQHTEQEDMEEKSIALMKERISKESPGITTIIPINQKVPLQFINAKGEFVDPAQVEGERINATYVCDLPGLINPYGLFDVITRRFECGSGYQYTVVYNISAPVNIVAASPYYPSIVSRGTIKLKKENSGDNSPANLVYTEENIPVNIVALGDDPNNPDHFLFRCTFTSSFVPYSTVTEGVYVEPSGIFATDCIFFPGVGSGPVQRFVVWGAIIDPNDQPCTRTDLCFINPSSPGILGSIAGSDVLLVCSSMGIVVSEMHDFEYRVISGYDPSNWQTTGTPGSWQAVPVTTSTGVSVPTGTIAYFEVKTLPSATFVPGVYEFRYRNRMVIGTGAPCTGQWSPPTRWLFN